MSIDNDTNTDRVPSSGIPSADSPPSVNVPPPAPAARKPKSASAERQQRFRERKKGREAGFAVPKRSSGPRVHRTTATRPDFSTFNAGASYAKPASSTDPAAAFRAGALPAVATPPEESKVTEEEAAMYARGLVFYTKMGVVALMQKQKLTPEQMQEALTEYLPFVEALVGGCTVGVVKRWNIRVPFIEEGVVAAAIGISTFALTWGQGDHMLSNALAIGKGLASGKVPVVAVGAGEPRGEARSEPKQETPSASAEAGDDAQPDGAPVDLEKFK